MTARSSRGPTIEGMPLTSHVGLWAVALALGSVTAIGVWIFNEAIDAVGSIVSDVLVPALGPLGAWSIVPILALAGVLVAGIVRFMKPEQLAAMGHIIDGVAVHEGRLGPAERRRDGLRRRGRARAWACRSAPTRHPR